MTAVLCSKQIWNLSFWLFNCWKCTNFHSMIINDHCKLHSFSSCHDHSSVTLVKVITLNYFCFVSPLYLNQQSAPAGMTWHENLYIIYERPKWTINSIVRKRLDRFWRFRYQNLVRKIPQVHMFLDFSYSPRGAHPGP